MKIKFLMSKWVTRPVAVIFAVFAVLFVGFYIYTIGEGARVNERVSYELSAIANLKVNQIKNWRERHLMDAKILLSDEPMISRLKNFISSADNQDRGNDIYNWFKMTTNCKDYSRIRLYDANRRVKLSYSKVELNAGPEFLDTIKSSKIEFHDLHRHDSNEAPHFEIIIPLCDFKSADTLIKGYLVFQIDPKQFLYPLINTWPTESHTAETLIFSRVGNQVIYLNELRNAKNSAFNLGFDIDKNPNLSSVMALKGKEGIVDALDYRGNKVKAYLTHIPNSQWYLIAKIDKEEIDAPRTEVWINFVMTGALLTLLSITFLLFTLRQNELIHFKLENEIEKENRKLLAKYEHLTKHANDMILICSTELNIIYANNQALKEYGYSFEEIIEHKINDFEIVDLTSNQTIKTNIVKFLEGVIFESRHFKKDGTIIPVEISAQIINYEDSEQVFFIIRDNTERKRNEDVLKQREVYLRTTLYSIGDAVITTDSEGCVEIMNNEAEVLTGWKQSEASGHKLKEVFNIINEKSREKADDPVQHVFREKKVIGLANHTLLISRNGSEFPIADSGSPIIDVNGEIKGVILVFRDQTRERHAESILKASEEKYRNLFDNSDVGMLRTKFDGSEILDVNNKLCQIFGYTPEELIGKPSPTIWADQSDREEMIQILKKDGVLGAYNCKMINKNKEIRYCLISLRLFNEQEILEGSIIDITENKIAELNLKKSEKSYRSLFENMLDGMAHFKMYYENGHPVDYEYIEVNPQYDKLTGLKNVVGKRINELIPDYTKNNRISMEVFGRVAKTGIPERFEHYLAAIDRWFSFSVYSPSEGEFITLFDNITERKKMEEELRKSEEFHRILLTTIPELIVKTDIDGNINFINETIFPMLRFIPPDDIIGKNIISFVSEEDKERSIKNKELMFEKMIGPQEYILKFDDGTLVDCEVNGDVLRNSDENPIGMVFVLRDISERKITEKELLLKTKLLAMSQNVAHLGSWMLDLNSKNMIWSDEMYKVFDIDPKNGPLSLPEGHKSICHPDDWEKSYILAARGLTNKEKFEFEARRIYPYEHIRWIYVKGEPQENENGEIDKFVGIIQDITERKMFEEELIKEKDRAEQSDKLKTSFLQNMSHEIRTPLNGIMGFSNLLKDFENLTEEERIEYLSYVLTSSNRLLGIVDDVLEISRLDTGLIKSKNSQFYINEVFHYFNSLYSDKIYNKNLFFKVVIPENCSNIEIKTDKEKLYQILTNLMNNALKFTNSGGIEIGCYNLKNNFSFYVKDTGIGIKQEYLDKVFDRFWQFEAFSNQKFGGTGLGLSISKGLSELIGVEIKVESELDVGTTFSLIFPDINLVNLIKDDIGDNSFTSDDYDFSDIKILIVEDEESNHYYLEKLLTRKKAKVVWVMNGLDAVNIVEQENFDLILMDLKMPIMDGFEASWLIKMKFPNIPIIAQTAYSHEEERETAIESGCDDFISKPIVKENLYSLVKKLVKKNN